MYQWAVTTLQTHVSNDLREISAAFYVLIVCRWLHALFGPLMLATSFICAS